METVIGEEDVRRAIEKLAQFRDSLPDAERAVVDLMFKRAEGGDEVEGFTQAQMDLNRLLSSMLGLLHDTQKSIISNMRV